MVSLEVTSSEMSINVYDCPGGAPHTAILIIPPLLTKQEIEGHCCINCGFLPSSPRFISRRMDPCTFRSATVSLCVRFFRCVACFSVFRFSLFAFPLFFANCLVCVWSAFRVHYAWCCIGLSLLLLLTSVIPVS